MVHSRTPGRGPSLGWFCCQEALSWGPRTCHGGLCVGPTGGGLGPRAGSRSRTQSRPWSTLPAGERPASSAEQLITPGRSTWPRSMAPEPNSTAVNGVRRVQSVWPGSRDNRTELGNLEVVCCFQACRQGECAC